MESDVQPSPVAVPQDVIAIAAEAAATAAAAAGAPPALIGSIVRSVVSYRHHSMAWTCSVAGASQEAGSGMGMQQRVPQYVPSVSSLAQCMAKKRPSVAGPMPLASGSPRCGVRAGKLPGRPLRQDLHEAVSLSHCASAKQVMLILLRGLEILFVKMLANLHGWMAR